jgi:hypothetical protein
MDWAWTARRWAISAFLVVHVSAVTLWVLPASPLRLRVMNVASYYILPLGLWQYWGMFAPDPVRDTVMLEAEVVDARGLRYSFAFPRLADYSKWRGVPRVRHSKFAANMAVEECATNREFAARHVVRRLGLPASAFPVVAQLLYQVRLSPPPGGPPPDPMTPTRPHIIATYRFPSLDEVMP